MKLWSMGALALVATAAACHSADSNRSSPALSFAPRELPDDLNPDGIGLNLGSLEFDCDPTNCDVLNQAINHAVTLRARWIRLEISNRLGRDLNASLDYWAAVVARIPAGIRVLGVLNNTLWDQGASDPDQCDDVDYAPTDFGNKLVTIWLPIATAYVERLQTTIRDWEIWNEANAPGTKVCKSNYAFLLTEASIQWRESRGWDLALGPSTHSLGSSTSAKDYLDILFNNTQKVLFYRSQHQDNPPWARVYDHPYPCHSVDCGTPDEAPGVFLANQAAGIRAVQPAPIWFSELGFQDTDDQVNNLFASYDAALNRRLAEKVFWFSLTDCARLDETYGLLPGCSFTAQPRPSYWAFQSLSTNSLICRSITPCKFTSAAAGCDSAECPAIKFQTGWGQTVHETSYGYSAPQCTGAPLYYTDDYLVVPSGGFWIIWVQLPFCPAPQYSANWSLAPCPGSICGDNRCSDPTPNCDQSGAAASQALEVKPFSMAEGN